MLPHNERNRTYVFNGGRGAVLCETCRTIVAAGLGPAEPCAEARTTYHATVGSESGHVFCSSRHRAVWERSLAARAARDRLASMRWHTISDEQVLAAAAALGLSDRAAVTAADDNGRTER